MRIGISNLCTAALGLIGPAKATPPPPSLPDWRSEITISPLSSTLAAEWVCQAGGAPSIIRIEIRDVGQIIRNHRFEVRLVEFLVAGRQPGQATRRSVVEALLSFNTIATFQGRCRGGNPALFLRGFPFEGGRDSAREVTLDL